jgi:hypothetical protein
VHIPVYEAVDALCITPGACSQLVKRCRSEAISMHTGLWSKVFSRVSVGEIAPLIHLCSAEFTHDR